MNRIIIFLSVFFLMINCKDNGVSLIVNTEKELQDAIKNAKAGDEIVMVNGTWKDVQIKFTGNGTERNPIILRADTAGKVFIEGESNLKLGGEYLVVDGLYFRNGYTPTESVIEFQIDEDQLANNCRVTNCVIKDFNQLRRDRPDHWVEFWGRYNKLDHCYIAGKSNQGPTIRVYIKGNESIKNHHQIIFNHFGPRPRKGGPRGETIQIGESFTSMSPSNTVVANNLFERCNGEVEVISSKSDYNKFRNNVFYKCEGSLVMRHGNYCIIDGNYFIGDHNSDNIGGIRIINTGHWITNNYFYELRGEEFRSPLALMNGIPKSPLNRYNQVTDVVVAHNTWINCKSPWHFGVGSNVSQADVLPLSEIRSAVPIRTIVANNIIYNQKGDPNPLVAHDRLNGINFKNNVINNQNVSFGNYEGLEANDIEMTQIEEYIFVPVNGVEDIELYQGFEFETIVKDLFGNSRSNKNFVGAISRIESNNPRILDTKKYGPGWYSDETADVEPKIFTVTSGAGELTKTIAEASDSDIIELTKGIYHISNSLIIDKKITIKSKDEHDKAQIIYSGDAESPLFEMHPRGSLVLKSVILKSEKEQYTFATLKENMSSLYNLNVLDSEISHFKCILKAYKETFADEIKFTETIFENCINGIVLSAEVDDLGDYNAEFLTIDNCKFNNIKSSVIDYYRGGYDESTIGGNLSVTNSTFTNCGGKETNGILLNTRGIVNVDISDNTFKNNPVKLVALLWGAKNNTHSENEIINSGKLVVEENLKLKLVY